MKLGISLGYNASACIIDDDGKLLYAASEERFTNDKNCKSFPMMSIQNGLKYLKINPSRITECCYSHYQNYDIYDLYRHTYYINDKIGNRYDRVVDINKEKKLEHSFIEQHLYMLGIECDIKRISHHKAHAYSSYSLFEYTDNSLYIVMDGFGDGISISAYKIGTHGLVNIYKLPMCYSIALLYQFVTGALGFKEHQHEGKITGLASFGNPIYLKDLKDIFESFLNLDVEPVKSPIIDFGIFVKMKRTVYEYVIDLLDNSDDIFETKKNIAASVQQFTEDYVIDIIKEIIDISGYDICNIYLSGGLFANVKLNQHIHECIDCIKNIFITPCMGDEGTCIGAVMSTMYPIKCVNKISNRTMRIGTKNAITEELIPKDINYTYINDIDELAKDVAEELSMNKIICLFDDRMEFGPRALIGRSILYNCKDINSNKWLNEQLGRTEFMPFAPFCKEEYSRELFYNVDGKEAALKNMTITVNCKEYFVKNYPAACHVDGTARPQIINKIELPIAWKILDEYERITKEKALINTSFNLHNFPIIESVENAIYSWSTSNTQCLYINSVIGWYKLYK